MTAVAERLKITEPGVYDGMPDEVYHGDPVPGGSLSASGAKLLLPPSCPARFKHARDNPAPHKREFDLGHAAHRLVLGVGPELVVVKANDWRTKAAREQRDAAYAAGAVPLLEREYEQVQEMASALRRHPLAGALFQPGAGRPEQSAFWHDTVTGVMRRARFDWLPHHLTAAGRLLIPDYKTTDSADLESIQKTIHRYRYYIQAAGYVDAAEALLVDHAAFVFVFQEKTAPYLVTVVQLDELAMELGRRLNRQALDLYARCVEADHWPDYAEAADEQIPTVRLPAWVERQVDDQWP